jgi:hypothetical protein
MIAGALSAYQQMGPDAKKKPVKLSFTSKASGLTYEWSGDNEPSDADLERMRVADAEYVKSRPKPWKSAAARTSAENKLRDMRNETNKAQAEAASGVGGAAMWASGELAKLSKEAKKALAPLDKAVKDADRRLAAPWRDYAADLLLPKQAAEPVKQFMKELNPSDLATDALDTASRAIADPKQELYQQFGVAFDPKARPEERIGAGINMIGLLIGAGMKGKTISQALKKMPVGPEYYALMKKRGINRAEASKIYKDLQGLADMEAKITAPATSAKPKVTGKSLTDVEKELASIDKAIQDIDAQVKKASTWEQIDILVQRKQGLLARQSKLKGQAFKATTPPATAKQADSATVETEAGYAGQPKPKDLTGFKKPTDEIRKAQAEPELKAYREKYGATAPIVPERVSLSAYIEANYKARQQGLLNAIRNSPTGAFSKALGGAGIKETKAARAKLIAELERDIASGKVNAQVAKELEDTWNKANPKGGVTPKPNPPTAPGAAATQAADVAEAAKPKPKRRASATKKQAQPTTTAEPATSTTGTSQPGATKPPVVPTTANQGAQPQQSGTGVATAVAAAPTEAQATVAPPPIPAGAKTAAAAQGPKTAGNNASINRRRIFEGREEIESGSGTVADRTFDKNDYDYNDFQESLRRRAEQEKPAPFDKAQQEAWNYHREKLEERQAELNARTDAGDKSAATLAEVDALDKDINIADKMGVEAGTIGSLAFSARRSNPFDYSPANIKFNAFKANGKEKLSPEVAAKLQKLLDDEKKFSNAASEATKFTEAEAKEAAKFIIDVGKGIKKAATAQQRAQALDAFREGIRNLMNKASLGLDPMDLVKMAPRIRNLARAWVAPGSKLDDVVDGILADAEMIAKQDHKLAPVLLKPDGSLLLDREDIIRVLASREKDGVRALRDNIDIDLEAKRFEIDALMADIKSAAQYKSMGPVEKGATEFGNFTRGLRLGFDLAAPLNQGRQALASHPKESIQAFGDMFRAAKSEEGLNKVMGKLRTSEHYKLAVSSKLQVNAAHLESGELGFVQTVLLHRLGTKNFRPGPASNRAMMGYLNSLRYKAFESMVNANLKMTGRKAITQTEADNIAEFVNTLTGAGTGKIANALKAFNDATKGNAFTAPSYATSKGKLALGTPLWRALGQATRTTKEGIDAGAPLREAAKNGDVATFLEIGKRYGAIAAGYSTVYGLLALNGAKIDFRQNSPLSMQVKLPGTNMWIEPAGGLNQIIKLASRTFLPNPDMDRETQMQKVGEYGQLKTTRPDPGVLLGKYMEGKLAPSISSIIKISQGEAYGKKYNINTNEGIKNIAMNFGPLTAEQINDIRTTAKGDPKVVALMIFTAIFGNSVNIDEKEVARP